MSTTKRKATGDTFRIARPMDDGDRMAVRPLGRMTTLEIVGYGDDRVRRRLAGLDAGDTVRLSLGPAADAADGCVVTRVRPVGPSGTGVDG